MTSHKLSRGTGLTVSLIGKNYTNPHSPNNTAGLTHEHILVDFSAALMKPEYGCDCLSDLDLKMENLGKVQHFP